MVAKLCPMLQDDCIRHCAWWVEDRDACAISVLATPKKQVRTQSKFVKPTLDEVRELVRTQRYSFDPQAFYAFYESNGWMVGKNKMKDWKAAARNWNSREVQKIPMESRPTKPIKVKPCPACGGKLSKNTQTGKYFCDSCWETYKKEEVEEHDGFFDEYDR